MGDKGPENRVAAEVQAKQTPPPVAGQTTDAGTDAGRRVQVTAEVHPTEAAGKEHSTEAGGGAGRKISTRSAANDRKAAETTLVTSLRSLELERDERNIGVHEVLCRHLL